MALSAAEREGLIRRYAEGPAKIAAALAKVPAPARKWRPQPGKWSVHEVICHCADSEMIAAGRIRYLAGETQPVIQGYDQEVWAQALDYHNHPLEPALATVEAVRANTVALLRHMPESLWSRTGTHTESGPYTAEDWLKIYARHLEGHTEQIERNLAAWKESGGGS